MIEQLLEQYRRRALVFALGFCDCRDDAEDLVQDASIKAWAAWQTFNLDKEFWPWFERIIRNCWLDKCQSLTDGPWIMRYRAEEDDDNFPQILSLEELMESGFDVEDPGPQPLETIIARETQVELWMAMARLPGRQAECVQMRHIDGMKYREIAERLDIKIGSVQNHINRGLLKLRKDMELVGAVGA